MNSKKIVVSLLCMICTIRVLAYDVQYGNYYFNRLTPTGVDNVGNVTTYHYNVEATSLEGGYSHFAKTYSGTIAPPATFTVTDIEGNQTVTYVYTLTKIGDMAFANNYDATELIIPETVTEVSNMGLLANMDLTKITCLAKTPPAHSSNYLLVTAGVSSSATLYVPAGCKTAYKNAVGWKEFSDIKEIEPSIGEHDYVDLGLPSGKLWSTCNYGATSSTEYGEYVSWSAHDPVTSAWGEHWRTPTQSEVKELINNCTWTWTTIFGVSGYNVTGKNGNSLFLPAAGFQIMGFGQSVGSLGIYWTSTPTYQEGFSYTLICSPDNVSAYNAYNTSIMTVPIRPIVKGITNGITVKKHIENNKDLQIFDINGLRLSKTKKGINIIKFANGTVKKVFVK